MAPIASAAPSASRGTHRGLAARFERLATERSRRARALRVASVVAGVVALAWIVFGASLAGRKVLLPLDLLAAPNVYLGDAPPTEPQFQTVSDLVFTLAPTADFARDEARAGRMPLWNPYSYCGSPLLAAGHPALFSPIKALHFLFPPNDHVSIAWVELARCVVGALGLYAFLRGALRVSFAPALVAAWCFPFCGNLANWRGFSHAEIVTWLPWLLFAIERSVRRPFGPAPLGIALVTTALLVGGHLPTASGVLLLGGAWFALRLVARCGVRRLLSRKALGIAAVVAFAVVLGVLLSAPQTLPTVEYLSWSRRATERAAGFVDIPPFGPRVGMLLVAPFFEGSGRADSTWLLDHGNTLASTMSGYSGLVAALVLAPLAFVRRRRGASVFFLCAGIFGASQALDLPLLSLLHRLPPLSLVQSNRLVFFTAFATLVLAALGFDALLRSRRTRRAPLCFACATLLAVASACAWRAIEPPALLTQRALGRSQPIAAEKLAAARTKAPVLRALHGYRLELAFSASFALAGLAAVGWIAFAPRRRRTAALFLGVLVVAEAAVFARRVVVECPRELDYPPQPALEDLARDAGSSRVCGVGGLPAALNLVPRLREVRGYDALDPAHVVELADLCRAPEAPRLPYAALQWFFPRASPLVDLLGLRWFVVPRATGGAAPFAGLVPTVERGPWRVFENPSALPRAFVPKRVECVADSKTRLARLADPGFDPRALAFVEHPTSTPIDAANGRVSFVRDDATNVELDVELDTPGLVVLTDTWYPGWHARVGERELEILRADHAFRGVELPAGKSRLAFTYEPESFRSGLRLAAGALVGLVLWFALVRRRAGRT
ncbi:MAG: hypothetical protein K8S98_09910 [Planctomycetes bacterium]|nr:hypothetical protein [Planctomycetota bacterium]